MTENFKTPILLIIFNRLDTTKKVLQEIKKAKPKYLYIASDGARATKEGESATVKSVREYVLAQIDWDCEVKTLFRDENLGCGLGPYNAISWFFENVEQGIILEDDCLPLPGFFDFCERLLDYYKDDDKVYEISGTNLQAGIVRGDGSYYFSKFLGIWGWASWARAWKQSDYSMTDYEDFKNHKKLLSVLPNKKQREHWERIFDGANKLDAWDYQWQFAIWLNQGYCIIPNFNLIENIGFHADGTHTLKKPHWYNRLTKNRTFTGNILHPSAIKIDDTADDFLFAEVTKTSIIEKLKKIIKKVIRYK